ncbi:hypothetical protein [Edaphobacter sp. 12200R-103]|uniref:hypothetical protein n=1 Tax=Edaphobacter sp. 12200R-103 TaxID=2703788 RepID=UPI00138D11A1|nr:hypothetical protein [Edaphobacter sp. 12200R-103]QHS52772.1 hypothetical protein GWR55_14385 [Edaphobacter sp. 12200R-103]
MIRFRLFLFALLCLFLAPSPAHSQIAVYAGYSAASINNGGTDWAYGPLFGAYKQTGYAANIVSIGGDLRASFLSHNNFHYYTGAAGPRIAFKAPILPFRPYVEGLVGVGNVQTDGHNSSNHFNYQVLGGLDTTLLPRLDWRVVEFSYNAVPSQSVNAKTLTTGLVLRIW